MVICILNCIAIVWLSSVLDMVLLQCAFCTAKYRKLKLMFPRIHCSQNMTYWPIKFMLDLKCKIEVETSFLRTMEFSVKCKDRKMLLFFFLQ